MYNFKMLDIEKYNQYITIMARFMTIPRIAWFIWISSDTVRKILSGWEVSNIVKGKIMRWYDLFCAGMVK